MSHANIGTDAAFIYTSAAGYNWFCDLFTENKLFCFKKMFISQSYVY